VLKPDHIRRRQMDLLCRTPSWFGGNGGGDRRGVFAVGVPAEGVVLGMECNGCHDQVECLFLLVSCEWVWIVCLCGSEWQSDYPRQKHEARSLYGPGQGSGGPSTTLPAPRQVSRGLKLVSLKLVLVSTQHLCRPRIDLCSGSQRSECLAESGALWCALGLWNRSVGLTLDRCVTFSTNEGRPT